MSNLVKYRIAVKEDLKDFQEIFNYYILHTNDIYDKQPRDHAYMEAWWTSKMEMDFPIYVAFHEKEIVGFASYGSFRRWEGYSTTIEHSVYVKEGSQSKGIGHQLMELLIKDAIKRGYHSMIGGIDSANKASLSFHKKLGFLERARIPEVARKNNQFLELVLMQKILSTNPSQ